RLSHPEIGEETEDVKDGEKVGVRPLYIKDGENLQSLVPELLKHIGFLLLPFHRPYHLQAMP
ncbi:hypothetical protein A2U01_0073929, partial [Trifolium medium]|nr:hypothetical protein [Trifolium medium]